MKRLRFISVFTCVMIAQMIPTKAMADDYELGDLNHDGYVDVLDVVSLINRVLSGHWSSGQQDDHEWVDLGLPSGTLWATCNVGADTPEEYGDYFAWGETEPKEVYDWSTYKWTNQGVYSLTKYCTNSTFGYNGFVDNKTELDPEDDAAYVNWGENWRMPTYVQLDELNTECTWTWTTQNGVYGRLVTGPNGNTIFLPASGLKKNTLNAVGSYGIYWTRTLSGYPGNACSFRFYSEKCYWYSFDRYYGLTVRPVCVSHN